MFQDIYAQKTYKSWRDMFLNRYTDNIPRGVYEPLNKLSNIESSQQLQFIENDMTKMEAMKDDMESLIGDIDSMRTTPIEWMEIDPKNEIPNNPINLKGKSIG